MVGDQQLVEARLERIHEERRAVRRALPRTLRLRDWWGRQMESRVEDAVGGLGEARDPIRLVPPLLAPLLLVPALVLLSGCGLSFVADLSAPADVVATADQVEQITLTWSAVANANHYYVYRALLPAGPFGPDEAPHRTIEGTGFVDIDVPDSDYYYRISAGDALGRLESPMSSVVQGTALVALPTWQLPALIGFGTGVVALAVDNLVPEDPLYVLTAPATEGAALSVSRVVGSTLVPVGDPFGAVDGTVPGSAAIAATGQMIAVFKKWF